MSLGKPLLCGLYESLGHTVGDFVCRDHLDSLHIGGHIWLLQLLLRATFSYDLNIHIPPSTKIGVEGVRLAQLTPDDGETMLNDSFEKYFYVFIIVNPFFQPWRCLPSIVWPCMFQ